MKPDPGKSSPDPLDDWLAAARWPEAPAESTRRLRQRWQQLGRRRRLRWELLAPLSAAAVVGLAIGLAWLTQRRPPATAPTVARSNLDTVPVRSALLTGRPPTVLESMMIRAATEREKKAKAASKPANVAAAAAAVPKPLRPSPALPSPPSLPPPEGRVVQPTEPPVPSAGERLGGMVALLKKPNEIAVARYLELVADPATRRDALAALTRVSSPPIEQLIAALGDSRVDRRVAAALALGRIDGPVLTRRLIDMVAADQNRREAFIALASSRGEAARAFVQRAATSEQLAGLARSTLAMNELQRDEVQ